MQTTTPVTFCFVSREDFEDYRKVSIDPDSIATDYDVFVKKLDEFAEGIRAQGGVAIKVYIKPAELAAWCHSKGRRIDASAKATYAATLYAEDYRSSH
jgi:hypothetical protein